LNISILDKIRKNRHVMMRDETETVKGGTELIYVKVKRDRDIFKTEWIDTIEERFENCWCVHRLCKRSC